jgi:hypothetical protein
MSSDSDYNKDPITEFRLSLGTIEDSFAHTGAYIVHIPGGPPCLGVDMLSGGNVPLGARPAGQYAIKTRVLLAFIPGLTYALIMGPATHNMFDPRMILPESVVLRSRVGIHEDPMHFKPFVSEKSIISNHSAGRPADIIPGDWGVANDLGLMLFIGRIMATLKASDGSKLECFWGDDLTRITGYNLETHTAGGEYHHHADEGEYRVVERSTPFLWEALGISTSTGNATKSLNGVLKLGSEEAPFEPKEDDQTMIFRHLKLGGYLGDIEHEFICAPPSSLTTAKHSDRDKYIGLMEIVKHINGAYSIRSAKEISFEKYIRIPVPKELKGPSDPEGDSSAGESPNYKAAGQLGSGQAHDMPEFTWASDNDPGHRTAQWPDYHAYLNNKYYMRGLVEHENDWYVPNENELTDLGSRGQVNPSSINIGHKFIASLPDFATLVVDQRQGHSVRYYQSRSLIKQFDDGSIVIEDGYGSQIAMKGGNIHLSCVGDVIMQPGRSCITLAPFDAVVRAGHAVDISAAKSDVRIKAEKNLHCLAGNNKKDGGILLESRSEGGIAASNWAQPGEQANASGIVLKSEKAPLYLYGKGAYLGTGGMTGSNPVTIDAGEQGVCYVRGDNIINALEGGAFTVLSSGGTGEQRLIQMSESNTVVSTGMLVGGSVVIAPTGANEANLIVGGELICHKSVLADGNILTNKGFASIDGAPFVGDLNNPIPIEPDASTIGAQITTIIETTSTANGVIKQDLFENSEQSPGNSEFLKSIGFSFRDTVKDLKLDQASFALFETRWQQLLRNAGGIPWDEPVVEAPGSGGDTLPWPGKDAWKSWSAYKKIDNSVNHDDVQGIAKGHDQVTSQGSSEQPTTLSSGYIVNVQE